MNDLGYYYEKQKDYDNIIKYYLMAIDNDFSKLINNSRLYLGASHVMKSGQNVLIVRINLFQKN